MRIEVLIVLLGIIALAYLLSGRFGGSKVDSHVSRDKPPIDGGRTEDEWRKRLSPEEYHVLREKGTEMPFTGEYVEHKGDGVYVCAACGNELFSSDTKFESGTGWPSFWDALSKGSVVLKEDGSHGMVRTEVLCARCGGHLGHLFDDGPQPTGKRYCINSVALDFKGEGSEAASDFKGGGSEVALFGMGCFWSVDALFGAVLGVVRTRVGYSGGAKENPTYRSLGDHTETVEVIYDPSKVSYERLLELFWGNHDPYNSAYDKQYRDVVFYKTDGQRKLAEESKKALGGGVKTEVLPASDFYPAEDYHQKYFLRQDKALMKEFNEMLGSETEFRDSTAAARVNGIVGGRGGMELERELADYGLSNEATEKLQEKLGGEQNPHC